MHCALEPSIKLTPFAENDYTSNRARRADYAHWSMNWGTVVTF
jgi:hypothetical protein